MHTRRDAGRAGLAAIFASHHAHGHGERQGCENDFQTGRRDKARGNGARKRADGNKCAPAFQHLDLYRAAVEMRARRLRAGEADYRQRGADRHMDLQISRQVENHEGLKQHRHQNNAAADPQQTGNHT